MATRKHGSLNIVEIQAAHYFNTLRRLNLGVSAYHAAIPHWGHLPQSVRDVWMKFIPKVLENTKLFFDKYNSMPVYDGETLYNIYAITTEGKSAVSSLPLIDWARMMDSAKQGWNLLAVEYNKDMVMM